MAGKSLADLIRERVMAQFREKFGGLLPGETVPPVPGVTFRGIPQGGLLSCVECPVCYSVVLQASTASHADAHLAEAQERARRDIGDPEYTSLPTPGG